MYGHIKMVCCKITVQTDFTRKSRILKNILSKLFLPMDLVKLFEVKFHFRQLYEY